jgi:predicted PurR-regulated permease PerM
MSRLQQVGSGIRRVYSATRATMRAREREATVESLGGPEIIAKQATEDPESDGIRSEPAIATAPSVSSRDDSEVPKELRIAAAYSWRLIILAVALAGVVYLVGRLSHVVIPLAIALLLSALLGPLVRFLRDRARFPPSLAAGLVLVTGLAAVIGTLTLVVTQIVDKFDVLSKNATEGAITIRNWLQNGPLDLETKQIDNAIETAQNWLNDNQGRFVSTAQSTATATIEALAAFAIVLFATFFFMRDGAKIWRFLVRIFPRNAEEQVHDAGVAAWATLGAYVRATVLVAFIDAVGIGTGLFFLNVTLWFPLSALVFLFAFVPIIGATLSGGVAVLVTLVERGPWEALIALVIVIAVQQLEGHVLQPLIMGRAVAIHPLAVIVGIAAGVILAGIMGALVSVPIIAVLNTAVRFLVLKRREMPPDAVVVASEAPR